MLCNVLKLSTELSNYNALKTYLNNMQSRRAPFGRVHASDIQATWVAIMQEYLGSNPIEARIIVLVCLMIS